MKKMKEIAPALSRREQRTILGAGPCPKPGTVYCLDVYKPVICPNGQVYSNSCYAYRACQTNCRPYGGDTI
jgi:hypothetical protein